jgi:SAM-dependent methyltransferase
MGSAAIQGRLWGSKARDWAAYGESTSDDLFNAVLKKTNSKGGSTLLDIGCGAGGFCKIAAGAGFNVSGFDASEELTAIARERLPHSEFKTGEMEELPYGNNSFDIVTGINSFQFADDIVKALTEARRVSKPGGQVIAAVWSKPEDCDASIVFAALGPYMPPPPHQKISDKKPLFTQGVLEGLAGEAGLKFKSADEIKCIWNFDNEEIAVRGMMSAGLIQLAIKNAGEEKIKETISGAMKQFSAGSGKYVMKNTFRCIVTENPMNS